MASELTRLVRDLGEVPVSWAGATHTQDYVNVGDALSPVMVALLSGRPVRRVPFQSESPRLAAVGTIGQNMMGGRVWFWGTGCSPYAQPSSGLKRRYAPDPATDMTVAATRGPLSAALLGAGRLATATFGDPVWLLPQFYNPPRAPKYDLGVIIHLSDLADRALDCHPAAGIRRYDIPDAFADRVTLINTVAPISIDGIRAKIDQILACRRIVSTSLHGLVWAESYGIPCLPFPPSERATGLAPVRLDGEGALDARMTDLYTGLGRDEIPVWHQPRGQATDWAALIAAIDAAWRPATLDEAALAHALPLDLDPLSVPAGGTIWDHPVLRGLTLVHDPAALRRADRAAAAEAHRAAAAARGALQMRLAAWNIGASVTPPAPRRLRLGQDAQGAVLPLAWAAGGPGGITNIGDALSAVVVAALSGQRIAHVAATSAAERLVAVGTIAHNQRGGCVHFWGTGLDGGIDPMGGTEGYRPPPDTDIQVHAMRGPFSANHLRRHGVAAPDLYGDPVMFLPRIFDMAGVAKTHDLGVVLHLSELDRRDLDGQVRADYLRYQIPSEFQGHVRLINMFARADLDSFHAKIAEIASCRAILSTSLHGLVIAEAYGIPSAWFSFYGQGLTQLNPMNPDHKFDHRMRDLYAGQGRASVPVYGTPRHLATDWAQAIAAMTAEVPVVPQDLGRLFAAFPGPLAVGLDEGAWPMPRAGLAGVVL